MLSAVTARSPFVITIVGLLVAASGLLAACGDDNGSDDKPAPTGEAAVLDLGGDVYDKRCAGCHGGGGQGGVGKKLGGGASEKAFPDPADQAEVVRKGRGAMPAFGKKLDDAEIDAVVTYSRQLPG